MNSELHDVIIIGAGPAGIAAALHLVRYERDILLLEAESPAHRLEEARRIENLPGYGTGISGRDLAERFRASLEPALAYVRKARVHRLFREGESWLVDSTRGLLRSRTVILATGQVSRRPPVPPGIPLSYYTLQRLTAALRPSSPVLLIGGGEISVDYALSLRERGYPVTLISRRSRLKAHPRLEREFLRSGCQWLPDTVLAPKATIAKGMVDLITPSGPLAIAVEAILWAVGREPDPQLVIPDEGPGLFLAGDLIRGSRRQVAIALGDGVRAACEAVEFLVNYNIR